MPRVVGILAGFFSGAVIGVCVPLLWRARTRRTCEPASTVDATLLAKLAASPGATAWFTVQTDVPTAALASTAMATQLRAAGLLVDRAIEYPALAAHYFQCSGTSDAIGAARRRCPFIISIQDYVSVCMRIE